MLAERFELGLDEAFQTLRRAARTNRIRLADLAREVIDRRPETPDSIERARSVSPPASTVGTTPGAASNVPWRRLGSIISDRSVERVGANNVTFRDANERVRDAAVEHDFPAAIPFLCECADEGCIDLVRLTLETYDRIRSNPTWFVNAAGHEAEDGSNARVVERHDLWLVVEKVGRAGEMARDADPRAD